MTIAGETVIEVEKLSKTFRSHFGRRAVAAVRDVDLQVERGSVVAFVGPNGAGKTTTIFTLLGFLRPDRGTVRVFSTPAGSREARRRTGFQSEIFYTYGFKTAENALRLYAQLTGMADAAIPAAVARQLGRLGLAGAAKRKVRGFSKGMVQRLGIAQALLHEPELLIVDEPTTGLDPEGRKLVADIILEEKARGTTVFLSSHILADVERTCDRVVILREGGVVLSETMGELRRSSDGWEIELLAWTPTALESLAAAELREEKNGSITLRCSEADKKQFLRRLLESDIQIGAMRRSGSLEELYMRYAGGSSSG